MTKILNDSIAEEIVLAGIIQYGSDILIDTEDVVDTEDFFDKTNQRLYHALKFLFHTNNIDKFDVPTILSCMSKQFKYSIDEELLNNLASKHVNKDNILKSAIVVSKLSVTRRLCLCLRQTREHLLTFTGHEKIDDIIKDTEDPIFQVTSKINNSQNDLVDITEGYEEIIDDIISKPKDIVGLPTGFDKLDQLIGGGLRPGSVNVLAARTKVGKSQFSLNVTYNMAKNNIPVLYLDTELTRRYQMMRLIALHTKIPISEIETGQFAEDPDKLKLVKDSYDILSKYPITHCDISGQSINNILSIARRWLVRKVGFVNQKASKCLIVYDYIKLMDVADISGALKEYQLLGFLLSSIHDFSTKYELPVFATVQLNRDHDIAQSDRIEWLCSTMTILKDKLPEDLAEDNILNGDKKLIIKHTRFGPGLDQCDYINIKTNFAISSIKEGLIHSQVVSFKENKQNEE